MESYLIADRHRIPILFVDPLKYLQGYKLKHDPRAMDDASVIKGYGRLWNNWKDLYYIGWKNGPYPYKLEPEHNPEWNDINITYTSKLPLYPIEKMVELQQKPNVVIVLEKVLMKKFMQKLEKRKEFHFVQNVHLHIHLSKKVKNVQFHPKSKNT